MRPTANRPTADSREIKTHQVLSLVGPPSTPPISLVTWRLGGVRCFYPRCRHSHDLPLARFTTPRSLQHLGDDTRFCHDHLHCPDCLECLLCHVRHGPSLTGDQSTGGRGNLRQPSQRNGEIMSASFGPNWIDIRGRKRTKPRRNKTAGTYRCDKCGRYFETAEGVQRHYADLHTLDGQERRRVQMWGHLK